MATRVYPQDENRKREFTVKKIVLFLMDFGFSVSVKAIDTGPVFEDPVMQSKYEQLISEIRCLVCQNQSLADSDAPLAQDLRNEIFKMIKSEKSNNQITEFLVERYGDFVLYRPPLKDNTWLLWFGPFLFLIIAITTAIIFIKKQSQNNTIDN